MSYGEGMAHRQPSEKLWWIKKKKTQRHENEKYK